MVKEYKEREKKKWITIYDKSTHSEGFGSDESFSLLYSDQDWLWFSQVYKTPKGTIRILSENGTDLNKYESEIVFTINRESYDEQGYIWYRRIKDFIDFLWTDYIAVSDGFHSMFDLETWEVIKHIE